jgi:hypothetical protein
MEVTNSENKTLIFGFSIGGALLIGYLVYKAIGDYQTNRRIENIDKNIAKMSGGKPYGSKILDEVTLKPVTDKLENTINSKI